MDDRIIIMGSDYRNYIRCRYWCFADEIVTVLSNITPSSHARHLTLYARLCVVS